MIKISDLISEIRDNEVPDIVTGTEDITMEEKELMKQSALLRIRGEAIVKNSTKKNRKHRRRIVLLAAAITMLAALGVVAYATDLFQLGCIDSWGSKTVSSLPKDTDEYKAVKEYNEYINGLSDTQYQTLDEAFIKKSGTDKNGDFRCLYFAPEKAKQLCKKYHLKMENMDYLADTAQAAFDKAGVGNFLGDFGKKDRGGQYTYSNNGTVFLIPNMKFYCDLQCTPKGVFRDVTAWFMQKENQKSQYWDYKTKDGFVFKCAIYKEKEEGTVEEVYCFTTVIKDYIVRGTMSQEAGRSELSFTKAGFEKMIDQFDFSKL